jgi:choline dehydrogenase
MFSHVEKVITEKVGDSCVTARGVVFTKKGKQHRVMARKEVILSAGAINTPQIMLLSGLGPKEHLEQVGVRLVKDIPGVGQNLQDHVSTGGNAFLVDNPVTFVLPRMLNRQAIERLVKKNSGPLATFSGTFFVWYSPNN